MKMGDNKYITQTKYFSKDIEIMSKLYVKGKTDEILKMYPNMTKQNLQNLMSRHKVRSPFKWTKEDEQILIDNYGKIKIEEIAKLLSVERSYESIKTKAGKLGLKTREYWTEEEDNIIRKYYPSTTTPILKNMFKNRSEDSIIKRAKKLGVKSNFCVISEEDKRFIIDNYMDMTDKEIGEIIGKSEHAVNGIRFRMGLKKPKKQSYNDLQEYIRRNNAEWKKESMKRCGYKCQVTGKRFDDIHHIHGLNLILIEAVEELGYGLKDIYDYSEKELRNILDKYREVQDRYPYGVCLTKEVHMKFHAIYGYGNNTQEQWDEFLEQQKLVS